MEFGKHQSLVELELSVCSKLGHLLDSIMELSQLETFRLSESHKLKIYQWSWGSFKTWWNWTYQLVLNWGVYLIQLWIYQN
jgi:hypothetical protein